MSLRPSISKRSLLCGLAVVCAACGAAGPQASEPPPPAASIGDEEPPTGPSAEAPARSAPSGAGSIVVTARVDGQPVPAHVEVPDAGRKLEGNSGEPIALPSGDQRIIVTISDPSALLDKPTQRLSVFVEPGKPTAVDVTFRWAKVRLDVQVGGHSQRGVPVKLMRAGEVVAELKSGEPLQAISPGKYEADVLLHGRTIHVTGLQFLEGAEQTVPVRAQL